MPLKLVVLLRLVRLVNLPFSHLVQLRMPWLLFLIERVGSNRPLSRPLLGNAIQINGADTGPHHIFALSLIRVLWYHFVFGELGIWLKRILLLELFLLGLPGHLLLLELHEIALVHEEVCRIHYLLIIHIFLLEAHLSSNLSFSFVGEVG